MRILVTGCTGFIGSRLINLLLEKGHHIHCISRKEVCPTGEKVDHLQHDLSRQLDYKRLPANLDCIIHLAATIEKTIKDPDMFLINTFSTLNLLEYGEKVGIKKFIFISSGAVYGYSKEPLSEESRINPIDFYGLSKYQSELLVNHHSQQFSTVILRLFFPYGLGQTNGIIPLLANRIKNNEAIIIYNNRHNDGNPKINPIYITDAIKSIDKSLLVEGQCNVNICGDEVITIKELSLLIGRYLGLEPVFRYTNDDRIADLIGNNTKMKKCLDTFPTVPLKQGIQDYLKDSLA